MTRSIYRKFEWTRSEAQEPILIFANLELQFQQEVSSIFILFVSSLVDSIRWFSAVEDSSLYYCIMEILEPESMEERFEDPLDKWYGVERYT